eukprot:288275-Prymnesium_polylepis.1
MPRTGDQISPMACEKISSWDDSSSSRQDDDEERRSHRDRSGRGDHYCGRPERLQRAQRPSATASSPAGSPPKPSIQRIESPRAPPSPRHRRPPVAIPPLNQLFSAELG